MSLSNIRIGTRGSKLALIQAESTKSLLQAQYPDLSVEIEVISTAGDRSQQHNTALSEIGGKGLFTMEIEEKLLSGDIHLAVHSAKDMPTQLPEGLGLVCYLERENTADAFISKKVSQFDDLPKDAVIGSASLRRRAMMLRRRPDLNMVMFRGNVDTRLRKIEDGEVDATLLACAGLNRMGLADVISSELNQEDFLPAPGQGAVTIETALDNASVLELLAPLNHYATELSLIAERAFLEELDGSCRTPIGAQALISEDTVTLRGIILKPDGSEAFEGEVSGTHSDAREMGFDLGKSLKSQAGEGFFEGWS